VMMYVSFISDPCLARVKQRSDLSLSHATIEGT
jgi:hypothetical protein